MTTPDTQSHNNRIVTQPLYDVDLPEQAAEIRDLIGWPATMKLIESFGGIDIFVPIKYSPKLALTKLIGEDATRALISRYAGDTLYIAKLHHAMRMARNLEINRKFCDPVNPTPAYKLAIEYCLSERQIWNILKSPETLRDNQPDLFD